MSIGNEHPLIAFVWRPGDSISAVLETSYKVGCRAIFDLTSTDLDSGTSAMLSTGDSSDAGAR